MKEAYWGYWLMVLGIFIIVVLLLIQSFTSTNSQDFYLIQELAESSMVDAVDYAYYRDYGELKICKEKFYESFIRRFAEEASIATTYDIEFTEIYEAPPKIGIKVSSKANYFSIMGDENTFDIVNKVDAILESTNANLQVEVLPSDHYDNIPVTLHDIVGGYAGDFEQYTGSQPQCGGNTTYASNNENCARYDGMDPMIAGIVTPNQNFCILNSSLCNVPNDRVYVIKPASAEEEANECLGFIAESEIANANVNNICYGFRDDY